MEKSGVVGHLDLLGGKLPKEREKKHKMLTVYISQACNFYIGNSLHLNQSCTILTFYNTHIKYNSNIFAIDCKTICKYSRNIPNTNWESVLEKTQMQRSSVDKQSKILSNQMDRTRLGIQARMP